MDAVPPPGACESREDIVVMVRGLEAVVSGIGAQTTAFFLEVARTRTVWWVRDDEGSPMPVSSSGQPVFPYWSSRTRAQRAAQLWGPPFRAVPLPLEHWRSAALPDLDGDGMRVGINWSGRRLTWWDLTVDEVTNRLLPALGEPPYDQGAAAPAG
nr:DUF2750 domain-containing protein [Streptomyces sp. NBC_00995]